ncbi:MAG: type I-B CRISPR-associated protein Cas7/Cst2/DevR [Saprospiraceae bacterium]|jgi:CRISPR-associated protein Cst2|nr:type I-B CRISPR-associated protein Cas7/Cst2/DevR [Saprospiraceae bacterium]
MKNLKTQGFVLIDVDVAALNNAGKTENTDLDNGVATKQIRKNGRTFPYVSGQAWRYWWRNTLQKDFDWSLSPVIRESKIAFTAADPIEYADDDIFGYMRAASEEVTDDKGKVKKENVTVTRVSPLKNSAIISVASVRPAENWSSMSRQEGDAVPYTKQEYSAIMKGMFSLDLEQVGTFASYNKTGFKNLSEKLRSDAIEKGATEIVDDHLVGAKGEAHKLVRIAKETRTKRITETIAALKTIGGGAMQTNNMADVTPKFLILATMTSGNHPFTHVAINSGIDNATFLLNTEGISEVITDYAAQFLGTIYIGIRSGFLDKDTSEALKDVVEKHKANVVLTSVNDAIDKYIEQLISQIP